MKIALIVPGGVDQSGRERVIPALLWLIERLTQNHSVLVFSTNQYPEPRRYPLLGAEIINLGRSKAYLPGADRISHFRKIVHELRFNFDADILHGFWASMTGFLTVSAGKLLRKPTVVSVAGGEVTWLPWIGYGGQGALINRLQINWTLKGADRITAGSQFVINLINKKGFRSEWIPLGVDTNLLNASVERIVGPPWYLIHVASINLVKNQKLMIEALRVVFDHGYDAYLDWIGQDTLSGELQNYVDLLGIQNRIRFHGYLPLEEIIPLYRRAHLFIQSSLYEAQGVAVCEAAAMGVPTIGTNVGIVSELSPAAAVSIPENDKNMLASAIMNLLASDSLRSEIACKAQSWAQTYDADWTASTLIKQYESLINQFRVRI